MHFLNRSFCSLFAVFFCSTPTWGDWTDQAFPIKSHDFGTVAVGSKTEFRFPINNPHSTAMHIRNVRASCGCTTPIVETPYIEPGQTGSMLARFNTPTFRGKKGATLTVIIDQPFYAEVRLRVDGYIRSDMVFHPGELDFGSIDRGETISKATRVLYAGRPNWQILKIENDSPWLVPTFDETKRQGGSIEYSIEVSLREDAPEGYFQDQIVVITNDRSKPRVPLRVTGRVTAALSIAPQALAFGNVPAGQSIAQKLVIRRKTPFSIASIEAEGWDVDFEPAVEPKTMHIVKATFKPRPDNTGNQKRIVTIRTAGELPVEAKALLTADVSE